MRPGFIGFFAWHAVDAHLDSPGASTTWRRACWSSRSGSRRLGLRGGARDPLHRLRRRIRPCRCAATIRATRSEPPRPPKRLSSAPSRAACKAPWTSSDFEPALLRSRAARGRRVDRHRAAGLRLGRHAVRRRRHPGGHRARHHDLGQCRLLDAGRAAALHLDGRDPVPHAAVGGDVPRPRAVAATGCPDG